MRAEAVKYLEAHPAPVDTADFDKSCGVGMCVRHVHRSVVAEAWCGVGFSISTEELLVRVKEYVSSAAFTGWNNLGAAIGGLKSSDLRWANALELKKAVEDVFLEKFGAKEAVKPKGKVRLLSSRTSSHVSHPTPSRNQRRRPLPQRKMPPRRSQHQKHQPRDLYFLKAS